jgi:hypothetical protein
LNAFEVGDKRKASWVISGTQDGQPWSHPFKYKSTSSDTVLTEYYTVFRLAEQHLVRAEARAKLGKLTAANSAESDINIIRDRAGLGPTTAQTKEELLAAVAQERRVELFSEWGHRWFDLKRTGKADEVLSLIKPGWQPEDKLYPIPYDERQLNPNLTQNPHY